MDTTADSFDRLPPPDPAKWPSLALSAIVHLLLLGALFLGMQWHSKVPESVEVELWRPLPADSAASQPEVKEESKLPPKPAAKPEPRPEPKPVPRPEPKPEVKPLAKVPPMPVVRPEPRPVVKSEARPPAKPDLAIKEDKKIKETKKDEAKVRETRKQESKEPARKEEPKPKEIAKAVRKEAPKVSENKPKEMPKKNEPDRSKRMLDEAEKEARQHERENAAREQRAKLAEADAEMKQIKQQGERDAAKQRASKLDNEAYRNMIRAKIRGNIHRSPNIDGGDATFKVTQLPSGDVLEVRLQKSSGNPAFDEAVERAIRRSSPLPKPPDPELFQRDLILHFQPK